MIVVRVLPVGVVENGETPLSAVRLGPSPAGEGPGVLPLGHPLARPVLPADDENIYQI